jgi:hypothetical protein
VDAEHRNPSAQETPSTSATATPSAGRIADVWPAPWPGRPDLVIAALVLLERDGLVLVAAGATGRGGSPLPAG